MKFVLSVVTLTVGVVLIALNSFLLFPIIGYFALIISLVIGCLTGKVMVVIRDCDM
jgi:hypothetical protein